MTLNLNTLQIKSKNSVDDKVLLENIKTNYSLIQNWISPSETHKGKAILVSGGPSIATHMGYIKKCKERGYSVFCVKHSLPKLLENGVIPDGVFILDPRTNKGYSTHGVVREDLYKDVPDSVVFFVASMTSPDVTRSLINQNLNVVGWNANVNGLAEYLTQNKIQTLLFNYGTSSATRAIGVIQIFGFKHLELVGFDGDVPEPSPKEKRERNVEGPSKYTQIVDPEDGTVFWSTGELLAQVQDMETIVNVYEPIFDHFFMLEGGLGYRAFQRALKKRQDSHNNLLTGVPLISYKRQMDLFRKSQGYKAQILVEDKVVNINEPGTIKRLLEFLNIPNL